MYLVHVVLIHLGIVLECRFKVTVNSVNNYLMPLMLSETVKKQQVIIRTRIYVYYMKWQLTYITGEMN